MSERMQANSASAVHDRDTADRTLVIERVFKAPPDRVFKAWTDPAILVKWWGPEGFDTPDLKMDVRKGGAYRSVMASPQGGAQTVSGIYREVSPPHRLVMTWAWEQPDGSRGHETVVEVTFEAVSAGTRMRLVQRLFQTAEQKSGHNIGWMSSFNDLDRILA